MFSRGNERCNLLKKKVNFHYCFNSNRFILIGVFILAMIACFILYPMIDFSNKKALSHDSTFNGNLNRARELLSSYTSNGTTSTGNDLQDLINRINELVEKYDNVQKKVSDNRDAITEKRAELEHAGNLIAAKEAEIIQAKVDWDYTFKKQEEEIETSIVADAALSKKIENQNQVNEDIAAQNKRIQDEIDSKKGLL